MADPAITLGQSTGATLGALPAMPPAPNVLSFLPRERAVQQQIQALPSPALPKLQPVPQNVPPPQVTDPIKAMTPGMMILMALAGATTRHGMTGAVNNLTGYLTGIRQGDEQATKYAMDQFNTHFDAAIASNQSAIEEYHAAREKHGDDVQKLYDEMNGIATEKGDTVLQDQLRMGRFDEVFKILDARQRQADALQHQKDELDLKMAMLRAKPVNPASAAFAAFMAVNPDATPEEQQQVVLGLHPPRSAAGMAIQSFAKDYRDKHNGEEPPPQAIQEFMASTAGMQSRERTAGSYGARVDMAAQEVGQLLPQALAASKALPRGKFPSINKLIQDYDAGTSDPAYYDFAFANWSLLNAFTRAINPTGVPRMDDKTAGEKLLSTVTDEASYEKVLARMQKEVNASMIASSKVQNDPTGAQTSQAQQGAAPQFENGKTYEDANGNRATYQDGKWLPQ